MNLIHLPEIIDVIYEYKNGKEITRKAETFLEKHKNQTENYGNKRTAKARENSEGELVSALAKHMHIIFAVYPELERVYDRKLLIKSFVEKFIEGKNGNPQDMGWPSFVDKEKKDQICELVMEELNDLKEKTQKKHYTSYKEYDNLVSSNDEEETTSPKARTTKPQAETLKKIKPKGPSLDEAILKELAELRRFKEIVKANEAKISNSLKQKLRNECPSLYKDRTKSL
ncbi:MAG: hypothetical protein ACKO47_01170 [Alphaproteobacteria bacterium]